MSMFSRNKKKAASIGLAAMLAIATPFVAQHEGLRTKAYLDPVGIPTICYGETDGVKLGQVKSKPECDKMLSARLGVFGTAVDFIIQKPMKPKTHAAFTSFAYNIGVTAFRQSSAARLYNQGKYREACFAIATKDFSTGKCRGYGCGYAGYKQFRGLQIRRELERDLCLEGI